MSLSYPKIREVSFAIPNGGFRTKREARSLKLQGVTAGIPDNMVAYPVEPFHGLFIEIKTKGNKLTDKQSDKINLLSSLGYKCEIAYNWQEAKDILLNYINSTSRENQIV